MINVNWSSIRSNTKSPVVMYWKPPSIRLMASSFVDLFLRNVWLFACSFGAQAGAQRAKSAFLECISLL